MKRPLLPRPARRRGGFTLMEMIIAVAIMAIVVGAAVPVTSRVVTYRARKATNEELALLAEASTEFFRDTGRLPDAVAELLTDPGDSGWRGPYLPGVVADELSGLTGYEVDAWSRPYSVSAAGDVLTIASRGEDASFGTDRDLTLATDVTPVRRAQTLERLRILNNAIALYNAAYQATDPLPADFAQVYARLTTTGFLPADADFQQDAWGQPFVEDPLGQAPVVRVGSSSL